MRYQLQGERRFLCESVEFTVDGPVGQTDSMSEFFEVAPVHGMGVGHAHPFFEKALFQREDVRLVQMQACIDEVVGWSETVVSILPSLHWFDCYRSDGVCLSGGQQDAEVVIFVDM